MAGTINYNLSIQIDNAPYYENIASASNSIVQDAIGRGGYVQEIGTSEEVVAFGDVSVNGWLYLHNLDAANYVTWGPESAGAMVAMGRIEAGEKAWFRVAPSVVLRAQADTGAVLLDVRLYED